jgi:hypothetical protein
MICKSVNLVIRHAVVAVKGQAHLGLNSRTEFAIGRFNCWLEETSCAHNAVFEQASALMHAHQSVSKSGDCLIGRAR